MGVSIWSILGESTDLNEVAKLSGEGADAKGAAWSPVDESLIAICSAGKLAVWKLTEAGAKVRSLCHKPGPMSIRHAGGPKGNSFCATHDCNPQMCEGRICHRPKPYSLGRGVALLI